MESSSDAMQLVLAAATHGAYVVRGGSGQLVLKGDVPAELLGRMKALRDDVAAAADEERASRWVRVPVHELPMRKDPPRAVRGPESLAIGYAERQGGVVVTWCESRAKRYADRFPDWSDRQWQAAAAMDLLEWQMARHPNPIEVLQGFEEAVRQFGVGEKGRQ